MSKKITKNDLSLLINKCTEEAIEKNKSLLENELISTVKLSVKLSSYTTLKILKELNLIDLDID